MNKDKQSSRSSRESLAVEEKQERQEDLEVGREIEWKMQQQRDSIMKEESVEEMVEMDEIGISGSKVREGTLARDVRRLKSATLDRMGKMLKIHSKSSGEKPDELSTSTSCGDSQDPSRKQKFNSLTRMLRFHDKEDKIKCFGQNRSGSLSRILRKKVPVEGEDPVNRPNEQIRGIFSRILGQIRGRMSRAGSENSQKKSIDDSELSSKLSPPVLAMSELNLESSCPVANTRNRD